MKSYTDIEQSRKLAKILPLESADGGWYGTNNPFAANTTFWLHTKYSNKAAFPAWSLAALLSLIPKRIKGYNVLMVIDEDTFAIWYEEIGFGVSTKLPDITNESAVDACVEMVVKLHELNLL